LDTYPKSDADDRQYLTNDSNRALNKAKDLAKSIGDDFVSIEIVTLGILQGTDKTAKLLRELGADEKVVKAAIAELRKGRKVTDQNTENQYNALGKYAINLNEQAENGKLDPIIGRDDEIRRVLHILSRKKKNNPILIGEPGVGKTAVVEGLAWRRCT
jgi:ATP-dependent Clp protease ATP-binding subunit ClpB